MKRILFPFLALISGFILAFIAAGVSSLFFIMLPLLAFVFGYFSSWQRGLLCGVLLFFSYTFATALMWQVPYAFLGISQYFSAFFLGGFGIVAIGIVAPTVKQGVKRIGSIAVLLLVAALVSWCAYLSIPTYRYTYQLLLRSQEDTELYLPIETTSHALSSELLNTTHTATGSYGADIYKQEVVDTPYGQMWNIGLRGQIPDSHGASRSSNWFSSSDELRSWQMVSPLSIIQLQPSNNNMPLTTSESKWPIGFILVSEFRVVKEFTVPVRITSDKEVTYELMLTTGIYKTAGINFGYTEEESYSERIVANGRTSDNWVGTTSSDWVSMPVKASYSRTVRGLGD